MLMLVFLDNLDLLCLCFGKCNLMTFGQMMLFPNVVDLSSKDTQSKTCTRIEHIYLLDASMMDNRKWAIHIHVIRTVKMIVPPECR